jgi:hypothetical protein
MLSVKEWANSVGLHMHSLDQHSECSKAMQLLYVKQSAN